MITIKDGVVIKNLRPELYGIFNIIDEVWKKNAPETVPVITSYWRTPGPAALLHGSDRAIDLRTRNLSSDQKDKIFIALRDTLYADGYDVIFEFRGQDQEHIHIEYDPKPGRGIGISSV